MELFEEAESLSRGSNLDFWEHDNPLLEAALDYVRRGWPVFPCQTPKGSRCSCGKSECSKIGKHPRYDQNDLEHGLKSATTDEQLIKEWWSRWPDANVGIVTGEKSGLVVLDVDPKNGGNESLEELENENGNLPDTVETITGSNGRHILFQHPGRKIFNKTGFKPGLDIRGDGGYIVAPPSLHVSGKNYEWELSSLPDDVPLAEIPEWLLELIEENSAKAKTCASEVVKTSDSKIPEGKRNSTLASLAGSMRVKGMSKEAIEAALLAENSSRCHPPLPKTEVKKIAESIAKYPPQTPITSTSNITAPQKFKLSDLGNAERLVSQHGSQMHYCTHRHKWLIYDGKRWREDRLHQVHKFAKETIRQIYSEANGISEETERRMLVQHALKSESEGRIRAMINLASKESGIPITPDEFDQDQWLLNCMNGTIDLKTGLLMLHQRNHLISKMAPVEYDPNATCPIWEDFLAKIMNHNSQLIAFLQRITGLALTGDVSEQIFFILYGKGANGKSTFLETIKAMLGDYAQQAEFNTFLKKNNDGVRNDIAKLMGARFVSAVEMEQGRRLAEVLMKMMTGGDTITARYLYQEYFEYKPTHKLFLATNHEPVIRGTDLGTWRRIRMIPFEVTIPDSDQDKRLPEKLRLELPGILNWAIKGCLQWQISGIGIPTEVVEATNEYREEMDVLGNFLKDCCAPRKSSRISSEAMYQAYKQWCETNGEYQLSQNVLSRKLSEKGYIRRRSGKSGTYEWHEIALLK